MSRPLRIAHVSDTHLGYRAGHRLDPTTGRNQRALDIERAYEAAVTDILTREVDLVIHGGDVFHHTRPSWSSLGVFVRQTRRLEAAALPTVIIAGNHDTPRLRISGSAFSVLELALPGITFATGYEMVEIPFPALGTMVTAVPHGALTNPNPPIPEPHPNYRNLLVTHGFVPGVMSQKREPGEEELSSLLLDAAFEYIALGHYHIHGPAGSVAAYSGSTERTGWGDREATPGYLLVTLAGDGAPPELTHVPLPARPMVRLEAISGRDRPAREIADLVLAAARAHGDPAAMLRLQLNDTSRPVRREVEMIVWRESLEIAWSLEIRPPNEEVFFPTDDRSGEAELPPLRTMFDEFVAERVEPAREASFVAAVRERGGRILDEAIAAARDAEAAEDSGT